MYESFLRFRHSTVLLILVGEWSKATTDKQQLISNNWLRYKAHSTATFVGRQLCGKHSCLLCCLLSAHCTFILVFNGIHDHGRCFQCSDVARKCSMPVLHERFVAVLDSNEVAVLWRCKDMRKQCIGIQALSDNPTWCLDCCAALRCADCCTRSRMTIVQHLGS